MNPLAKRAIALSLTIGTILFFSGCAHEAGGITLTSQKTHQKLDQGFAEGYFASNANGDLDIVLIDQATAQILAGQTPQSPVHQILHLRVLWEPSRETKASDAAYSNATVRWYVLGGADRGMLEYSGTGFVTLTHLGDLAQVRVQNALVRPLATPAGLVDPVGASEIDGTVLAHRDRQTVDKLLAEIPSDSSASTAAK